MTRRHLARLAASQTATGAAHRRRRVTAWWRLLGATLRWKTEGLEHFDATCATGHQPIMAFWHGRILPATYYFRRRGIVVITSENFDGEWIAGIIERFGYGTARGSTSRGGLQGAAPTEARDGGGQPAGFTVDGPRGPARVAQPGAVWLSKATGTRCCRSTSKPAATGRCGAGIERRFRSRSQRSPSSSANPSRWRPMRPMPRWMRRG